MHSLFRDFSLTCGLQGDLSPCRCGNQHSTTSSKSLADMGATGTFLVECRLMPSAPSSQRIKRTSLGHTSFAWAWITIHASCLAATASGPNAQRLTVTSIPTTPPITSHSEPVSALNRREAQDGFRFQQLLKGTASQGRSTEDSRGSSAHSPKT